MLKLIVLIGLVLMYQPPPPKGSGKGDAPLSEYRTQTVGTFTVLVRKDADTDEMRYRRVLAALRFDIDLIDRLVPADALDGAALGADRDDALDRRGEGQSGHGMCYHESAGWLTANGYDAAREGVVEILNMDDFLIWRAEQPMMLLHEMAHAYHAMIGNERDDVKQAYAAAKKGKKYEAVHHVLLAPDKTRPGYAMNNPKEYFAELTEAWFGRNDFEPFTHDELLTFDPDGAAVVDTLWHLSAEEIDAARTKRKH